MATQITERAVKIAEGVISKNQCRYQVWADFQVGQRAKRIDGTRWWLLLTTRDGKRINQSTMKPALYQEWVDLIAANGKAA